jgi:perosamine synthetase
MFDQLIDFIQDQYRTRDAIPLHAPVFTGNEKTYLTQCIDSTFVSSVGSFVGEFETAVAQYERCRHHERHCCTTHGFATSRCHS